MIPEMVDKFKTHTQNPFSTGDPVYVMTDFAPVMSSFGLHFHISKYAGNYAYISYLFRTIKIYHVG